MEDLIAFQLAAAFKTEAYRLLRDRSDSRVDFAFRRQLLRSAASVSVNIAEGFYRHGARGFARFLSIALGSLAEAELWLRDGIDRQYFEAAECAEAFVLAKRCRVATLRLHRSLRQFFASDQPSHS